LKSAPAAAETWYLKGQMIWKNVVMDYFNAPSLDLTQGKEEYLQ
jgi:hypothetical protein